MLLHNFVHGTTTAIILISALLLISACGEQSATPASNDTPAAGAIMEVSGVPYVYVPAGEFMMGSPDGIGGFDEHPHHAVLLDAFWIMQTEVTNAQFAKCVAAGACTVPDNSRWQDTAYADHPVTAVDWSQANAYAEWVGGRLPTEAEWEKAARGTDGRTYPWGDEQPNESSANCCNFVGDTMPVGSYPAGTSPYGLLDMAGNVWEWTADWYDSRYYGESQYADPTGPTGPFFGDLRALRGGSFLLPIGSFVGDSSDVRSAGRLRHIPGDQNALVGFRVVASSGS